MTFPKIEGMYEPGCLYSKPQIHKRLRDPPLSLIISKIGTVTYETSKCLNSIIVPYMPRKFNIKSTYAILALLRSSECPRQIASLDVENLFTNVPVDEAIEIILKSVWHHGTMPAPKMSQDIIRILLKVCTTRTPFRHIDGELYIQLDGVSIGKGIGPSFADFYMCNLETEIFNKIPLHLPILQLD